MDLTSVLFHKSAFQRKRRKKKEEEEEEERECQL
jgi:hypothetical protein